MPDTITSSAKSPSKKPGRKPKHATGVPGFLKGAPLPTILPDVLTAEFVRDHAGDVLHLVYMHAANDPTTARWLAENIFAVGGWKPTDPALNDPSPTPASLEAAQSRAVDSYVAGHITAATLGTITKALTAKLDTLACMAAVA